MELFCYYTHGKKSNYFSVKRFPKLIADVSIGYHSGFASEGGFLSANREVFVLLLLWAKLVLFVESGPMSGAFEI